MASNGEQCDQKRPVCGQCIKNNLACEGYDKRWTFVHSDSSSAASYQSTSVVPRKGKPPVAQWEPLVALPHTFNRTAFESQSFSLFWDLYLPAADGFPAQGLGFLIPNWAVFLREASWSASEALRLSLLAMCLARIGHHSNDRSLIEEGMKQYVKALAKIHDALNDGLSTQSDEVGVACELLATYEVSDPSLPSYQATLCLLPFSPAAHELPPDITIFSSGTQKLSGAELA